MIKGCRFQKCVPQQNAQWPLWDQHVAPVWKVDTAAAEISSDGLLGLRDVIPSASLYGTGRLSAAEAHVFGLTNGLT